MNNNILFHTFSYLGFVQPATVAVAVLAELSIVFLIACIGLTIIEKRQQTYESNLGSRHTTFQYPSLQEFDDLSMLIPNNTSIVMPKNMVVAEAVSFTTIACATQRQLLISFGIPEDVPNVQIYLPSQTNLKKGYLICCN